MSRNLLMVGLAVGLVTARMADAAGEPSPRPTGADLEMGADIDAIRHDAFEKVAGHVRDGLPDAAVEISVDYRGVEVVVHDRSKFRHAQEVLDRIGVESQGEFAISHPVPGRFSIDLSRAGRDRASRNVQAALAGVVQRGLRELGIGNASVSLDGESGIRVGLPGFTDLGALQKKFGPPPALICLSMTAVPDADLRAGRHPDGTNLHKRRPTAADPHPAPVATDFDEVFSARDIRSVRAGTDRRGRPVVSIRLDNAGRQALAKAAPKGSRHPMVVILAGVVVSAPVAHRMPRGEGVTIAGLTPREAAALASELEASTAIPPYSIFRLVQTYGADTP